MPFFLFKRHLKASNALTLASLSGTLLKCNGYSAYRAWKLETIAIKTSKEYIIKYVGKKSHLEIFASATNHTFQWSVKAWKTEFKVGQLLRGSANAFFYNGFAQE